MKRWLAVAVLLATATTALSEDNPLKVCLDENLPPLSMHQRGKPDSGFDLALAQAVAGRLGRPLNIQWFESKLDESASPALEANALLSDGRCALVGSFAFTKDSLVVPGVKTAKLPDFQGATRDDRRRRVPVGVLAPSRPYVYSALTIVLAPRLGAAALIAAVVAGQMLASLALDHWALVGFEPHPLSVQRALGAALVIGGVALVR